MIADPRVLDGQLQAEACSSNLSYRLMHMASRYCQDAWLSSNFLYLDHASRMYTRSLHMPVQEEKRVVKDNPPPHGFRKPGTPSQKEILDDKVTQDDQALACLLACKVIQDDLCACSYCVFGGRFVSEPESHPTRGNATTIPLVGLFVEGFFPFKELVSQFHSIRHQQVSIGDDLRLQVRDVALSKSPALQKAHFTITVSSMGVRTVEERQGHLPECPPKLFGARHDLYQRTPPVSHVH